MWNTKKQNQTAMEFPQLISASTKKTINLDANEEVLPTTPQLFVSYPYMIAIMAVLQVMTVIYGARVFIFFGLEVSAGWLILMPIMLYIFQIVSECYGWQYSRQIIWCNFIVNLMVLVITFSFKFIPIASLVNQNTRLSYLSFIDNRWVAALTMLIGVFISDFVASALMCWSRFQLNGRFILIRMLVLHCMSEIIILSGSFIVSPYNGFSSIDTWMLVKDAFIGRCLIMIILLPVARYVIWYIQHRVEGVVVFDYKNNFSPFKFGLNLHDALQFKSSEWKIMPNKMKKNFNFVRAMLISQSQTTNCNITIR
jgi:uncharacterized PurR-regulated membrane protein YhhQ (DUF165 family)